MAIGGIALRLGGTFLYALEFCCASIILGIYSYFLSVEADRDIEIPTWQKAVTGLSGATVLYTIFAVLLTCFLGGKSFFALLGMIFDILCAGAMLAVVILTRDGASSCTGDVQTPLGDGPADSKDGFGQGRDQVTYAASLGTICRLNTVCFAVAIIGAFLFIISIPIQLWIGRHHKKEKRFGPSPSNGYTKGSGIKFWKRNQKKGLRDPEVGTISAPYGVVGGPGQDVRPSHDTAYTGSTVTSPGHPHEGYKTLGGGYHTAPTGTYQHNTNY